MADAIQRASPLAIICGGGSFPGAVAEAVTRQGRRPVLFGLKGWAAADVIEKYAHHWIVIGQIGNFFRLARSESCRDVLFIGSVVRPPIRQLGLDWQTIKLMPSLIRAYRGGDDRLLGGLAKMAEDAGFRIVGLDQVAPEVFVSDGALGHFRPSAGNHADIVRGLETIRALGPFDIGQAAVVANNQVLAVEAAEGTDNMIARVAELRRLGRVAPPPGVGVLVKAPKPGQDRRFDLPSIGPRTVENVAKAGLAGIAVSAGSTIIADAAVTIAAADRAGIFIAGVSEDGGAR
jgi:UDP-2,3-diacylglucosamine hydrolase